MADRLLTLVTLWWLLFWTAVGLCLGSFLNVVIYRLPRDQSLRDPRWSFCPRCRHRIAWYDNVPILGFVLLRGRCRHCHAPISTRYVVIEAATALIVLMLLDAFFVGQSRSGLSTSEFGLTDQLDDDWPIYLAHVILFACLLPMAVIDLEHYWVDVRFTNFAAAAGFVLHTLWTPRHSMAWIRPGDSTAVMAVLALAGVGIVWIVRVCNPPDEGGEWEGADTDGPSQARSQPALQAGFAGSLMTGGEVAPLPDRLSAVRARVTRRARRRSVDPPSRMGGWITCVLLAATLLTLGLDASGGLHLRHAVRALVPLMLFFVLIVSESMIERISDHEIIEAIQEERHGARGMVLREFALLIPAIAGAVFGWWVMSRGGEISAGLSGAMHGSGPVAMRHWSPLYGLATAAGGYVIAGAVGWAVRIVFTLLFGKEAFGSGDIHLMAATGCVAGWPVVVLGFFLTCGLALVGWAAALPFKRTRALPLGPWLALSFLAVVMFYDTLIRWPVIARAVYVIHALVSGGHSRLSPLEGP